MRATWFFIGSAFIMAAPLACGGGGASGSSSSGGGGSVTGSGGATSSSSSSASSSASGTGGSGGGPMKCTAAKDCPGEDNICGQRTCDNGACGIKLLLKNMPVPSQTYGDCKTVKCDDKGTIVVENDDMDVYDDGNPCSADMCKAGMASNDPVMSGSMCTDPNNAKGVVCDATATCVQCVDDMGCMGNAATPKCIQGRCVPTTCNNMMKDGTETSADCGGLCLPCPDTGGCKVPSDCLSGVCKGQVGNKTCAPAACDDNVKNGNETDIDCGGKDCPAMGGVCDTGQHCKVGKDCLSGVCKAGLCEAATCTDGLQNGDESGTDCGGSCPTMCAKP